jgi:hypothetical protein
LDSATSSAYAYRSLSSVSDNIDDASVVDDDDVEDSDDMYDANAGNTGPVVLFVVRITRAPLSIVHRFQLRVGSNDDLDEQRRLEVDVSLILICAARTIGGTCS